MSKEEREEVERRWELYVLPAITSKSGVIFFGKAVCNFCIKEHGNQERERLLTLCPSTQMEKEGRL